MIVSNGFSVVFLSDKSAALNIRITDRNQIGVIESGIFFQRGTGLNSRRQQQQFEFCSCIYYLIHTYSVACHGIFIHTVGRVNLGTFSLMNQWVYSLLRMWGDGREAEMSDWIAGVDEAGRGPLAGPVVAAAVILDPTQPIAGLADSKTLSSAKRESLYELILNNNLAYAVGRADVHEIDEVNILQATMLAMRRAIDGLSIIPGKVLIDGNCCPEISIPAEAIIRGDQSEQCISAASIIAKVVRDREMVRYEEMYPGYGFAKHKGYGTREHYQALKRLGQTPIHRQSFRLHHDDL